MYTRNFHRVVFGWGACKFAALNCKTTSSFSYFSCSSFKCRLSFSHSLVFIFSSHSFRLHFPSQPASAVAYLFVNEKKRKRKKKSGEREADHGSRVCEGVSVWWGETCAWVWCGVMLMMVCVAWASPLESLLPLLQHFSNPVPHCICLHMYFFFPVPLINAV